MEHDTPYLKCAPKSELLKKVSERYPDLTPDAMEALSAIKSVAKDLDAITNAVLESHGLSQGRFYVLTCLMSEELMQHEDPSPSKIADDLGVTRPTITGLLDGLERDELIERTHHTKDRRALTIGMTDKGRELLQEFMPVLSRRLNASLTQLNHDELRTLTALLAKIDSQNQG